MFLLNRYVINVNLFDGWILITHMINNLSTVVYWLYLTYYCKLNHRLSVTKIIILTSRHIILQIINVEVHVKRYSISKIAIM